MESVIEVNNLSKKYESVTAVNNLSFKVKAGSCFGLLGANGAGKSTTIECILGTKKYDSGDVKILNLDPKKNRKELFSMVGVEFQENAYQREITAKDLCEQMSSLYKNPKDWKDLCEKFDLSSHVTKQVKDLSGGERQKLFIVLALIGNPKLLVLDELTTGLDAKARRSIWSALKSLKKQGVSILITSHFMDEIEELCDEICILKKGNVVFRGTTSEAKTKTNTSKFEDAYLLLAEEKENEIIL